MKEITIKTPAQLRKLIEHIATSDDETSSCEGCGGELDMWSDSNLCPDCDNDCSMCGGSGGGEGGHQCPACHGSGLKRKKLSKQQDPDYADYMRDRDR
jgi:hypothetical protein